MTSSLWCVLVLVLMLVCASESRGWKGKSSRRSKYHKVRGQGYRKCGHHKCLTDPGVHCDKKTHKCLCPQGSVGDGRIQCVRPEKKCICTIYGDPHVINFQNETFTLPLPCSHKIADLTTPPVKRVHEGCKVLITGRAKFPDRELPNPGVSSENQIDILITTSKSRFTTRINKDGFSKTNFTSLGGSGGNSGSASDESSQSESGGSSENGFWSGMYKKQKNWVKGKKSKRRGRRSAESSSSESAEDPATTSGTVYSGSDIDVQVDVDEGGFHRVIVPACHVEIKFRSCNGAFSLETPVNCVEHNSLCGRCQDRWNPAQNLSRHDVLELLLNSLHATSPIDNTDTNLYQSCTDLTNTFANCPANKKEHALNYCGLMLTHTPWKMCLEENLGRDNLLTLFAFCVTSICELPVQPCQYYVEVYHDCAGLYELMPHFHDEFCQI